MLDLPVEIYRRMIPALQVASALMEQARPHLVKIYRAPVIYPPGVTGDESINDPANPAPHYLDDRFKPKLADYAAFDDMIQDLIPVFRIFQLDRYNARMVGGSGSQVFGLTNSERFTASMPDGSTAHMVVSRSGIARDFFNELARGDWYQLPETQRQRVLVTLGITLLHEFVHVIWLERHQVRFLHDLEIYGTIYGPNEPLMDGGQRYQELGTAVESLILGGMIQFSTGAPDHPRYPNDGVFDGSEELHYSYITPEGWPSGIFILTSASVAAFFDSRTWETDRWGKIPPIQLWLIRSHDTRLANFIERRVLRR